MPLVSIIMPVYNAELYIANAINSILNQNEPDFELVVVNDGSIDNSKEIIQSFTDERIKYFEQPNKGVSAARNVGLEKALGKYICFLDADDEMPPGGISSRLEMFNSSKKIGFVDGIVSIKNHDLSITLSQWFPKVRDIYPAKNLIRLNGYCFFGPSWLIKKDIIGDSRFNENIKHGEDLLFFINLSIKNHVQYSWVQEEVLIYRKSSNSAMSNLNGLFKGYYKVGKEIKKMRVSLKDLIIYKLRAAKIVLLMFLVQKELKKATFSFFKIIFL